MLATFSSQLSDQYRSSQLWDLQANLDACLGGCLRWWTILCELQPSHWSIRWLLSPANFTTIIAPATCKIFRSTLRRLLGHIPTVADDSFWSRQELASAQYFFDLFSIFSIRSASVDACFGPGLALTIDLFHLLADGGPAGKLLSSLLRDCCSGRFWLGGGLAYETPLHCLTWPSIPWLLVRSCDLAAGKVFKQFCAAGSATSAF